MIKNKKQWFKVVRVWRVKAESLTQAIMITQGKQHNEVCCRKLEVIEEILND